MRVAPGMGSAAVIGTTRSCGLVKSRGRAAEHHVLANPRYRLPAADQLEIPERIADVADQDGAREPAFVEDELLVGAAPDIAQHDVLACFVAQDIAGGKHADAGHFQARHLLAFGWIALAVGMYFSCKHIDLLISFRAAAWMRVWQYLPVGFLFVPLTMAAYVGLPASKSNAAAGLINFTRNIGQSVGTSAVTTLLARRSQYHQSVLAEYTRSYRFNEAVAGLTSRLTHAGLSTHSAQQQATARLYNLVVTQAQALSYVEIYWLLASTSALMFLLCFLLAKNEPGKGGQVAVH